MSIFDKYSGLFGTASGTYTPYQYTSTAASNPMWTKYTSSTSGPPTDVDVQFIEALVSNVKALLYSQNNPKSTYDPYGIFYTNNTTTGNNPAITQESAELREFRRNMTTLLDWYTSNIRHRIAEELDQELNTLTDVPTPKTLKD